MATENSKHRQFYHGKDPLVSMPEHLYNKKTIQLAFDRFGPKTLPVNMQVRLNSTTISTSAYDGVGGTLPTISPKTPKVQDVNLFGVMNYRQAPKTSNHKSRKNAEELSSFSKNQKTFKNLQSGKDVRPIFMGKRLQQRINGLIHQ